MRATKDLQRAVETIESIWTSVLQPEPSTARSHRPLFPWVCPTAVSGKKIEGGVHEFVVEVIRRRRHAIESLSRSGIQL